MIIVVERPHQFTASAKTYNDRQDFIDAGYNGDLGKAPESALLELAENATTDQEIEAIGHDLHGLDILETPEEARVFVVQKLHNIPRPQIIEAMIELEWLDDATRKTLTVMGYEFDEDGDLK